MVGLALGVLILFPFFYPLVVIAAVITGTVVMALIACGYGKLAARLVQMKILAWKDVRLAWKLLILCALILIAMAFLHEIAKLQIWALAAFLLVINSTALFRIQELDTQDFFIYFQPVSRVRILASKLAWAAISTVFIALVCLAAWHIMNWQQAKLPWTREETLFIPYALLPMLFLPALGPLILVLYFRSSHITAAFVSCIAMLVWGTVVLFLCTFFRLALEEREIEGIAAAGLLGWVELLGILCALVVWNFYLFCRTDITEKPLGRSALLGIEFIFVFAWLAYFIGGANLWDLWYLLFG